MADAREETRPLDYAPPPKVEVPAYREILSAVMVVGGTVLAVAGAFAPSEPARVNIWVTAVNLIVWGLAIRFQHVRLR